MELEQHTYIIFKTQFDNTESIVFNFRLLLPSSFCTKTLYLKLFVHEISVYITHKNHTLQFVKSIWFHLTVEKDLYLIRLQERKSCTSSDLFNLFQCWCWTNWLLHCDRHHAGHGWKRGCCRHLQLCQSLKISSYQYGPDRGMLLVISNDLFFVVVGFQHLSKTVNVFHIESVSPHKSYRKILISLLMFLYRENSLYSLSLMTEDFY